MKHITSYNLFESLNSQSIEELQNKWYEISDDFYKNDVLVKAYIHENGEIILQELKSGKAGMGTKAMKELSKFADTYNLPIMTVASASYGSDIDRLIKFYNSFGFVYVKDMPLMNGVEMRREPNKFIKEWSEWNPVLNKKVLDYIETNKAHLSNLWDNDKSEEENIQFLVDYFIEYPDEMNSSIDPDKVKTIKPISGIKNAAPILQNIGSTRDFRSF